MLAALVLCGASQISCTQGQGALPRDDIGDARNDVSNGEGGSVDFTDAAADGGGGDSVAICPRGTIEGDYTIESTADVQAIVGCSRITGSLFVAGPGLGDLTLPLIKVIRGALVVSEDAVTGLNLPALYTVAESITVKRSDGLVNIDLAKLQKTGGLEIAAGRVTELNLPDLFGVDGSLLLECRELTQLRLPILRRVGQRFSLVAGKLASVSLPSLLSADVLQVSNLPMLTELTLPVLEAAALLWISDNAALVSVTAPALPGVGGIFVEHNAALTMVDLSAVKTVERNILIAGNTQLRNLSFPALLEIKGALRITSNPKLPNCIAQAISTKATITEASYVRGNDDLAICP